MSTDAPECDEFRKKDLSLNSVEEHILLAATYVNDAKLGRQSIFSTNRKCLNLYRWYYHPQLQVTLTVLTICHVGLALFEDPAVPGFQLPLSVTTLLEFLILVIYTARVIHIYSFTPRGSFISDRKNIFVIFLIIFFSADMIVHSALIQSGIKFPRFSRPLRPAFATVFPEKRQLRMAFRNLRKSLPEVFYVLILLFFSLAIFALMAFKLFGNRGLQWVDGRPYFHTYWDSFFDLYVLITTANNPDIMMPAYGMNTWYVLFFVVFLVMCFFVYMNIILAVIYNNYRQHLKNEVKMTVFNKREQLSNAFDLLAEGDGTRYFRYFFDLLTMVNAIVIGVSKPESTWDSEVEWVFLCLFVFEILLKLYSLGGHRFFRRMWNITLQRSYKEKYIGVELNAFWSAKASSTQRTTVIFSHRFDFVVIFSAFFLAIIEQASEGVKGSRLALDVLLVLRVLRLVKVIGSIKKFKVIILTIGKILPSLSTYGSIILFFYYVFAIVGMELFSGKIATNTNSSFCGNIKLTGTDFWMEKYCNNNFNDLIRSMIVMFELTVVNQWHVIAYGFSVVTSPAARIYFMSFHLTCVVLILNIFTAFVLEVFMLEYQARRGSLESQVEKKIHEIGLSMRSEKLRRASTVSTQDLVTSEWDSDDDEPIEYMPEYNERITVTDPVEDSTDKSQATSVRFRISKKICSVEVLLQKMFEKELFLDSE